MFVKFVNMISSILIALLLGVSGIMPVLDRVDSIIESAPDSAYVLLTGLDRSAMSRKETARFSVLYSMALDKKYIDVASDSIICNAVGYYRHHGNADYKMRTCYYQGLVKRYAGDIDGAMESYVRAEHYGRRSDNLLMRGRVYMGLKKLHWTLFDIKSARDEARQAAECFLAAGDTSRYVNARLDECLALNTLKGYEEERVLLSELSGIQHLMSQKQKNSFIIAELLWNVESGRGSLDLMSSLIEQMTSLETELWLSISHMYLHYGDVEKAKDAICHYEEDDSSDLTQPIYYLVKSKLFDADQQYREAFHYLNKYIDVKDSLDLQVMRSSAPYADEQYEHHLSSLKQRYQKLVLILLLFLAAFVAYFVKTKLKEERHQTAVLQTENDFLESESRNKSERIEQADQEISQLKRILSENTLDKEIRRKVDVRLEILNRYVANQISETSSPGGHEDLKALLGDRNAFLNSMTASFTIAHPLFVKYLKDMGLTEREAGCCCLYCIGLRGSEIASYLGMSDQSYYNFSSKMRRKLGEDGYTSNINIILKEKLKECDRQL